MIEGYEFYWHLLDALEDGVYFANSERKITYWNKAAEKITGYKSGETLGKSCCDNILCHTDLKGESLCKNKCPLHRAMNQGVQIRQDAVLSHKNGDKIPISIKTLPVRDKKKNIIGAVEIFTLQPGRDKKPQSENL